MTTTRGVWAGAGAYAIWGLFPLYWKLLAHVPASQIIAHRIGWSFVVLALVLAVRRISWPPLDARIVAVYAVAALLIGVNWFIYIWAVNRGFVVETSLGYFITPLVNVLLGIVVLKERLRAGQWVAVALAGAGVLYLTVVYGRVPWIAISLAISFGSYGLVKKRAPLGALSGLTVETGLLVVPAAAWLVAAEAGGDGAFGHTGLGFDALMVGAGIVTTVPLVLFAAAVRSVPLSVIGILQYIAPTLQFLLGVLVYREPFSRTQLLGFALIWLAVVVFVAEGIVSHATPAAEVKLEEGACH